MSFPPIHPFFPKIKYFCLAWCGVWGEGEGLSGCGGAVVVTHVETDERDEEARGTARQTQRQDMHRCSATRTSSAMVAG